MAPVATTTLWLAVVFAGWAAITATRRFAGDARLEASGARGLHAAAVFAIASLGLRLLIARAGMPDAPIGAAAPIAIRALWTDAGMRLLAWAAAAATAAALVPFIVRRTHHPERTRARLAAGAIALGFCLLAAAAGYATAGAGDPDGTTAPIAVHRWGGVVARLAYLAGATAMIVPAALTFARLRPGIALRWTLASAGLLVAALVAAAAVRYGAAAPPSMLDVAGRPTPAPWRSIGSLWAVLPLLVAAAGYRLAANPTAPATRARVGAPAALAAAMASLLVAAAVAPAIHDWTTAAPPELGFSVRPTLLSLLAAPLFASTLWLAVRHGRKNGRSPRAVGIAGVAAAAVTTVLAVAAGVRAPLALAGIALAGATSAVAATAIAARTLAIAHSAALIAAAAAIAATSLPPHRTELSPGRAATITIANTAWRLTSQGVSQEEHAQFDGAIVAVAVRSGAADAGIVVAGERVYRDDHGHAAARIAVPGVLRRPLGDLRLVVLGIRGDATAMQVQWHPLMALVWAGGVVTALALLAAAVRDTSRHG